MYINQLNEIFSIYTFNYIILYLFITITTQNIRKTVFITITTQNIRKTVLIISNSMLLQLSL